MPEDFGALSRPTIESRLVPGEALKGVAAAVHQKTFSGQLYAIGVTDQRLILQPVGRHGEAKGEPVLLSHGTADSVELDGAANDWWTAPMAVLNATTLTLKVKTADGQKLKLMMMKGGSRLMGSMSGGKSQEEGVLAIAEWIRAAQGPR
jgi:hypothetical protein